MHVGMNAERVADREHWDIGSSICEIEGGNLVTQKWHGNHPLVNDFLLALVLSTKLPFRNVIQISHSHATINIGFIRIGAIFHPLFKSFDCERFFGSYSLIERV